MLEQGRISGSDSPTPIPVVKVGQGEYTIDQDITVTNPLVVREGTLKVTGNIVSQSWMSNFVPFISVGGKNAVLELDGENAKLGHYGKNDKGNQNSTASMALGTADGKATINLKNGATLHSDQYIMAGDHDGQAGGYGGPGTGHVKATIDEAGNRYQDGDYDGQTVINIESGSTLSAGTSLQFAHVEVNIIGENSVLTDCTRGQNEPNFPYSEQNHASYLGSDNSTSETIETEFNIEKGGAFIGNWNLMTGGKVRASGETPKSYVNITVGSDAEEGKTSTFTVKGHFAMGDNLDVVDGKKGNPAETASSNSETTFTVKNGAEAYLNRVTVGAEGKADMIVEKGGKVLQVAEDDRFNYQASEHDFTGPVIRVNERGTVTNAGTIDFAVELNDGSLTMLEGASVGSVTANGGALAVLGDVEVNGNIALSEAGFIFADGVTIDLNGNDFAFANGAITIVFDGGMTAVAYNDDEQATLAVNGITFANAGKVTGFESDIEVAVAIATTDEDGNIVIAETGATVTLKSSDVKVQTIPEPTTATLSLLALAGLCARRRRA